MSDATATKQTAKRTTRSRPQSKAQPKKEAGGPSVPVLVPEFHVRHVALPQVRVGHVPVPRVHVPAPHLHLPLPEAVRSRVPDPAANRVLWYGGLAGLAAFGVIGWPVAGVVAAGTYVAEHRAMAALHAADTKAKGGGSKSAPGSKV